MPKSNVSITTKQMEIQFIASMPVKGNKTNWTEQKAGEKDKQRKVVNKINIEDDSNTSKHNKGS